MFKKLFTPIKIRNLELKNRVVMSAMGTLESHVSEDGYSITDKQVKFHAVRAAGGVGLNTTEVCSVYTPAAPHGYPSISEDKYIPGLKKICDAVHAEGGKAAIQLWCAGLGAVSDPSVKILFPSEMEIFGIPLKPIAEEEIWAVVKAYGIAAKRAVEAGFDAVEFHCGHNYLPHTFLSGGFNTRTDQWGGSHENRKRFPLECIKSIRANIPEGMPLLMRIDCHDDGLENGLTIEQVIDFCKDAKKAGVDVLNISRGNIVNNMGNVYEVPPVDIPNGINVEPAARIRKETDMLVMPCGRINTPEQAEKILEENKADLVVMARAQLADPEFCNKAKEGKLSSIKYCTGCVQGCLGYINKIMADPSVEHITCMRNPALLEEETMSLEKADCPKEVLIVGGGIAGLEAADALLTRGHHPILCEKTDKLGGQLVLAGMAPRKDDFAYAAKMAIQNTYDRSIDVHLNTTVTPEMIREMKPDAVIFANGSHPITPRIPGADNKMVINSHQYLANPVPGAKNAVVIGGGLVGIEVAELLVAKGAESVTVVEMKDSILSEMVTARRMCTEEELAKKPIRVMLNTTCKEIKGDEVVVEADGQKATLSADCVVMAIGSKPLNMDEQKAVCDDLKIPYYVVGDALTAPGLAMDAIREAYEAARSI